MAVHDSTWLRLRRVGVGIMTFFDFGQREEMCCVLGNKDDSRILCRVLAIVVRAKMFGFALVLPIPCEAAG